MKKVLAMLLALCMMLGVAGMATAEEEIVTLRWVTVGNGMPANYDSWIAQVNEYVGEKIGVNIEMQVIGWGDWEPRRNVIINTNEPYDIIFGNDGTYKLRYEVAPYFKAHNEPSLYPFVEIIFGIEGSGHYHIPITMSANGYSTYRGN